MNRSVPSPTLSLADLRAQAHPGCVVCDPAHPHGLRLVCVPQPDDSVEGIFAGETAFKGYPGQLHGGIAAALLDGAMTQCLFAHGIQGVTAELRVRYLHPLQVETPLTVRARMTRAHPPLYLLEAELRQNAELKARARGKFMARPDSATHPPDRV